MFVGFGFRVLGIPDVGSNAHRLQAYNLKPEAYTPKLPTPTLQQSAPQDPEPNLLRMRRISVWPNSSRPQSSPQPS